ncbi:MAG: response regulator [bacterium]|nr:response regulator [bacterium]
MIENAKILIVDDEEMNLDILKELVRSLGYSSILASDGQAALNSMKKDRPDLVLLDIMMPGLDGYQTLEKIKKDDSIQHIPVIMVSTIDEMESIVKCLQLGADDYLTKPFEPEILKARIYNSLQKLEFALQEKELLEKTLTGSLKILSEILALVNPVIFGRLSRIRRLVRVIAKDLSLDDTWATEIAVILSQIGTITIPSDILDKVAAGKNLLPNESLLYDKYPATGYELVKKLPRMEAVAEIIKLQNKNYDGSGEPAEAVAGDQIPVGARILHVVFDYDHINSLEANRLKTLELLREKPGGYDPAVIDSLERVILKENKMEIRHVTLKELDYGMIFVEDVSAVNGTKIISRGQEANYAIITRLHNIAERFEVKEPLKVVMPWGDGF